jgi:hypothetical protein
MEDFQLDLIIGEGPAARLRSRGRQRCFARGRRCVDAAHFNVR